MEASSSTLILCIICLATAIVDVLSVKVEISQGWLEGEQLCTVTGDFDYYSFKGIPYAQAPVGKLRFKAPRPPSSWSGVRSAKKHGAVCPQRDLFTQAYIPSSEDCLFLNVYTPKINPKKLLPVLLYIHGGAFKSQSGNTDRYGPDFLISHGIVIVTINYRIDALGFLCMDTKEVPGNAGLKDQVAALKWVNRNIEKFGGDPCEVTIMGQSAGGASVALHLLSSMSKGLFRRAISLTGAPNHNYGIPYQPKARPYILGKQLGCDTSDPNELLEFLQSLPAEKLVGTYPSIFTSEDSTKNNIFKNYLFTTVVEKPFGKDNFLTKSPLQYAKEGQVNSADILFGHTNEETLLLVDDFVKSYLSAYERYPEMLVPRRILITSPPDEVLEVSKIIREHYFGDRKIDINVLQEFVTYANDANFVYDIHGYLNALPNPYNNRRYFYIFSCVSGRNFYGKKAAKYGLYGASHYDDLQYIFNANALNLTLDVNSLDYELIQRTTKLITDFVKYGNPTPEYGAGVKWPEYTNSTKMYMDMGTKLLVKSNPDGDAVEFWNKIYDYTGLPHL